MLGDGDARAIGDIEQTVSAAGMRMGTVYEAIMVLAGKGDLAIVQDDAAQAEAQERAPTSSTGTCSKRRAAAAT